MKNKRHIQILSLINGQEIETQEELTALLEQAGHRASQGTISRDIRELGLIKRRTKDNRYVYASNNKTPPPILPVSVVSIELCGNIIVIRTLPGRAMAAAAELDEMDIDISGTIAGDDTIFCAVRDEATGKAALASIKKGMIIQ